VVQSENADGSSLWLIASHAAPKRIDHINAYVSGLLHPTTKFVTYSVPGKGEIKSEVLLPADYVPGRRYPVVVDIYPGVPSAQSEYFNEHSLGGGFQGFYSPELLAAKGYIVYEPANPTTLAEMSNGIPLYGMTDFVTKGIEALIAQGYADPERISIFGWSQGGISALWLATQTPRFKAVIACNSFADYLREYFEHQTGLLAPS